MKVKCVKNKSIKSGFFGDKNAEFSKLTVERFYFCNAVPIVSNWTNATDISAEDIKFLIFDDSGTWDVYPKELFVPLEEKE